MTISEGFALLRLVLASLVLSGESESWGNPEVCSIVVIYEDAATRDRAVHLCNALAHRFSEELDFEFTWWRFKFLSEPEIARQAARAALEADLIVVSVHHEADLPLEVKAWFERWLSDQQPTEGALVVLHAPQEPVVPDQYLRLVALRANLDYLPLSNCEVNLGKTETLPESLSLPAIAESNRTGNGDKFPVA